MARKTHSEEQILAALHEGESGTKVAEVCRRMGIGKLLVFVWKKKYAGFGGKRVHELRQLREERQAQTVYGRSFARSTLFAGDRHKEVAKPRHRTKVARWAQDSYHVGERHPAGLLTISRSTLRRNSRRDPQEALRMRLRELAASRVRYGYRR
jgi:putative transposase